MDKVAFGHLAKCSYCGGSEYRFEQVVQRTKRVPPPGARDMGIFDEKVIDQLKCTTCGSEASTNDYYVKECYYCHKPCYHPDYCLNIIGIEPFVQIYSYTKSGTSPAESKSEKQYSCLNCLKCSLCKGKFSKTDIIFKDNAGSTYDHNDGYPLDIGRYQYYCSACGQKLEAQQERHAQLLRDRKKRGVCLVCGKGFLFKKTFPYEHGVAGQAHEDCRWKEPTF